MKEGDSIVNGNDYFPWCGYRCPVIYRLIIQTDEISRHKYKRKGNSQHDR